MPSGFSWIDKPHLAALAQPDSADDLAWVRRQGIDILLTLTEWPVHRQWVNDAGLMAVHIPIPDMEAPSPRQFDLAVDTIRKAKGSGMGVAVHCLAGKGRTGTILAGHFVCEGLTAMEAIRRVRELRPGSIETDEQERAVAEFERRRKGDRG